MDNRRPKEHIYEERSSYQLGDTFAIHEWILIPLYKDYGEDFLARIVEKGALTGHDFYIQLKGTDRVEQYKIMVFTQQGREEEARERQGQK